MRPWAKWLAARRMGWIIRAIWLASIIPVICAHWFAFLPQIIQDAYREWKSLDAEFTAALNEHEWAAAKVRAVVENKVSFF